MVTRINRVAGQAAVLAMLVAIPLLLSAERSSSQDKQQAAPVGDSVELFSGIESGDIDVKFVAKNDRDGQVRIKNNTDRPLSVRLPEAFAAVPVLAQNFGGGGGGTNRGRTNNNKQQQPMGGGMMGGMGGLGGGGGGGFFNVAPEAEGKFQVEIVCLEHGKKSPRPTTPYELKKIESFTSEPALQEFLALLGQCQGRINHQAAQAAAWHLFNQMSWETLAAKRKEHANGASEPYFTPEDIKGAMVMTQQAIARAKLRPPTPAIPATTPSSPSLSQAQ